MNNYFTLLGMLCLLPFFTLGQSQYEISLEDLSFHSKFEEAYFKSNDRDVIAGLLVINKENGDSELKEVTQELKTLFNKIESKTKSKNIKKKAKYVFNQVHDQYFKTYEDLVMFDEIFTDNTFNCVSATALYGWVFREMNVPFDVVSTADHVYLVLTPEEGMILVESTDPVDGYQSDFDKQQEKLFKNLEKYKMVDEEGNVTTSLGEEHWSINFEDLVCIQYYNRSIEFYREGELNQALEYAQKSYFLATDPLLVKDYLYQLYYEAFQINDTPFSKRLGILYEIVEMDSTIATEDIHAELVRLGNEAINESDTLFVQQMCSGMKRFEKEDLELVVIEHALIGQYYLEKDMMSQAYPHILEAYNENQTDDWLKRAFRTVVSDKYRNPNETGKVLEELELYRNSNESLKNDVQVCESLLFGYLAHAWNHFNIDDYSNGMAYLEKADSLLVQGYQVDAELIGSVYYECWRICTRKKRDKEAKKWLEKGLKYNKFHPDLNRVKNY